MDQTAHHHGGRCRSIVRRFVSDRPTMPSLDPETIRALRILAGCDRASEDTLARQGVGRACLDALVARGVVRTYRSEPDNPLRRPVRWFVLVERNPGA